MEQRAHDRGTGSGTDRNLEGQGRTPSTSLSRFCGEPMSVPIRNNGRINLSPTWAACGRTRRIMPASPKPSRRSIPAMTWVGKWQKSPRSKISSSKWRAGWQDPMQGWQTFKTKASWISPAVRIPASYPPRFTLKHPLGMCPSDGSQGYTALFEPWFCRILFELEAAPVGVDFGDLEQEVFIHHHVDLGKPGALDFLPDALLRRHPGQPPFRFPRVHRRIP